MLFDDLPIAPQLEATVFWVTLIVAFCGGIASLVARSMASACPSSCAQHVFFGAMFLVASVTLIALGTGHSCWISGGGSLLFMSLVGTIDFGPAGQSV